MKFYWCVLLSRVSPIAGYLDQEIFSMHRVHIFSSYGANFSIFTQISRSFSWQFGSFSCPFDSFSRSLAHFHAHLAHFHAVRGKILCGEYFLRFPTFIWIVSLVLLPTKYFKVFLSVAKSVRGEILCGYISRWFYSHGARMQFLCCGNR